VCGRSAFNYGYDKALLCRVMLSCFVVVMMIINECSKHSNHQTRNVFLQVELSIGVSPQQAARGRKEGLGRDEVMYEVIAGVLCRGDSNHQGGGWLGLGFRVGIACSFLVISVLFWMNSL
jgi:hypothetical protein